MVQHLLLLVAALAIAGKPAIAAWTPDIPTVSSRGTWRVTLENRSPDGFERPVLLVNGLFQPTVEFVQGEEVEVNLN